MPTPPILFLYLLMQFMRKNFNFSTWTVSTLKDYFSFTIHFNSSKTILIYYTGLISYIIASIRLVQFGSLTRTASFAVTLVSIFAFFDFNYSCVTHDGMPLVPFLVTPWVSIFLMIVRRLEKGGWVLEITHFTLMIFFLHSIKKVHRSSMKWQHPFN